MIESVLSQQKKWQESSLKIELYNDFAEKAGDTMMGENNDGLL